jgi:hypothetical protein
MIKIEKRVTTEYIFNEYNKSITPQDVVDDLELLKKAGVNLEKAEISFPEDKHGFKNVVVTLVDTKYYDESVIDRMES